MIIYRDITNSSLITRIEYDTETLILKIEFKSGDIWDYYNVPNNKVEEMISAPSIGKYFLNNIKGKYSETKVK